MHRNHRRSSAYVGRADEGESDSSDKGRGTYTVGLFGDMPYNALGRAQYPALLADINASDVAFSVFDGDLKALLWLIASYAIAFGTILVILAFRARGFVKRAKAALTMA